MKVLHCLNSQQTRGIERLVIELAIAQKKNDLEVSIMLDTRNDHYYEYLLQQDIPILELGVKGSFNFNYATYKKLKKQFKSFQIIHFHGFSAIRSLAVKHLGVKTVYTMHGVKKEHILKNAIRESLKKRLLNTVDVFIANSNYTLQLAKQHYKLYNVKAITIWNGIKLSDHNANEGFEKYNNEFTIGLVSCFTPRKRIDRLIVAFKEYHNKGGQGKLVLVGDGAELNTIKKLVRDLNIGASVIFEGDKIDASAYYDAFDVVVCPSEKEPFGLVAVEAFLHGKPIMVFEDSGGIKEIIEPIEPYDIVANETELAERLLLYYKNKSYITYSAKQKIAYAKHNFSIERMERDYYKEYKLVLA